MKRIMKSDGELRQDVEEELQWEPSIDERRIGVAVLDGVVTLTGEVPSYAAKWKAERAAERVAGVRGVVNELSVVLSSEYSDTSIAKAALDALDSDVNVPSDRVKVKVNKGWITLTGNVLWDYQRRAAERVVRNLPGAKGVTNLIEIKPTIVPQDVKRRIEETLLREASLDAKNIQVEVNGGEITLRGNVRSFLERHEAEKAAWSAPGVTLVHNLITIEPAYAA